VTERLPPNQVGTRLWPTIGERDPEPFDAGTWRLEVAGLVERPLSLSFEDLRALPRTERSGTIHCVTRWSRPATAFRGVAIETLLGVARPGGGARFLRFVSGRGHDTTLPIDAARGDVVVADEASLDGAAFAPLDPVHGGPVRSVTFARYFYKSVKWLRRVEVLAEDRLGFWERTAGYHNEADPWREQRYIVRGADGPALRRMLALRDLSGQDLLSADLRGADLACARLVRASLRNVVLRDADLTGADLTGANLTNADLRGARLRDAAIDGVDLDGADLRGADLRGARGVPSSLAVAQFHSTAGDGALVDGLDWRASRLDGLLPEQEAWLRERGVV